MSKQKQRPERNGSRNNYYSPDQDIHFKMTTPEEEKELFRKARSGDEKAREFLITNHLLFAAMHAQSLVSATPFLPRDEVISAANFAVMKAMDKFKPERGFRFTTYLRFIIRAEISDLWRSKFSGGVPDPSLGSPVALLDGTEAADPDPSAEEIDLSRFNRAALGRALEQLTDKDRELIQLRYYEDLTLAQIGEKWGVTREAIRTFHARLMARLKSLVEAEGLER